MSDIRITGVRAIETAPQRGCNLIVVRVDTNQPGLYGLGCATFTQRHKAVVTAVNEYMDQLYRGRDALDVEDAFQFGMHSSYWRNGPVLNNAIAGVDIALWDILGKVAGLPVYRLLGGKCRPAVPVYRHANGSCREELLENVLAYMDEGVQYIRCHVGGYGGHGANVGDMVSPEGCPDGQYFDPLSYMRSVPDYIGYVRAKAGEGIELLHDVHERLTPIDTIRLAKSLEEYRLFFLEDSLAPEDGQWFKALREAAAVPLAMGELFNNPSEWLPLIQNRWIDYIRCHITQIGGITPARRLAALCEGFGVRTAWHGPGDVSPVGHMANLHLDLSTPNFGIQEWCGFERDERIREVFTGLPEVRRGYAYIEDRPGIGVDIDEKAAAKYPCDSSQPRWLTLRAPDGTSARA